LAMELSGLVIKEVVGKGSKSEHDAVLLETKDGKYTLRRRGGNPFRDPELDQLVGKRIRANGVLTGYTFVMSDWAEADDA
jgi:hypothetical protein